MKMQSTVFCKVYKEFEKKIARMLCFMHQSFFQTKLHFSRTKIPLDLL